MDRLIELGNLLDCYGMLLTERQYSILSQYAYEDCSLSEISERENISRQGVSDCINKAEKQLRRYEDELQIITKNKKRDYLLAELDKLASDMNSCEETGLLKGIIEELKQLG